MKLEDSDLRVLFMADQDPYMTISHIYRAEAVFCQGSIADLSLVAVVHPIYLPL